MKCSERITRRNRKNWLAETYRNLRHYRKHVEGKDVAPYKQEQWRYRLGTLARFIPLESIPQGRPVSFTPPAPKHEARVYVRDPITGQLWRREKYEVRRGSK